MDASSLLELLEAHLRRFYASHERARAQAGPSLFGSDRSVDHWTLGHAHTAIDEALADAVDYALAHKMPADQVEPTLRRFVAAIDTTLQQDRDAPAANEYGLRPSPAALDAVRQHGRAQVAAALSAVTRGRPDARLRRRRAPLPVDRIVLLAVAALLAALLFASF